jgi:shikimate kinase
MNLKLVRTPGIFLVGFMGSGKSTVGKLLADWLGWSFADLDADIEAEQKIPIAAIFDQYGEEHFRKLETEAIRRRTRMVRSGQPLVVALGGGAFTRPENLELLEGHGVTVWLDCPLELARRRVVEAGSDRPLARDPRKFGELYEARRPEYARADYRIEAASDDSGPVVEAIRALPIFQ